MSFLKKSPGSVESLSDNPPDNFPPKLRFFHKFLKKSLPRPRPLSEKKYQSEHFSRKIFFREKLIWTDKNTILTICFQSSKKSAECLEEVKKSWRHWFNQKKTVYLKKLSRFPESSFDNHAGTFQKWYVILLLNVTKKTRFPKKVIQMLITFQVKKSPWKNCSRQIKRIFDNRLRYCCHSRTKFCSSSENFS